jgi:hypothetical protein
MCITVVVQNILPSFVVVCILQYLLDKPDSDVTSLDAALGVRTSPDVISMIIPPRSKANVPLQFKPESEDQRTSVIFIRYNIA